MDALRSLSKAWLVLVLLLLLGLCASVARAEDASCRNVRFADIGWSDVAATTALASVALEALGYRPVTTAATIPVAFAGLKNRQFDAFLGYWSPAMAAVAAPYVAAGQIKVLEPPNLVGAKLTLAVPQFLYDRGLRSFADIARFQKELEGRIHGIESGSEANALIQGMIRDGRFGLGGFTLVEGAEASMLAEVQRRSRARKAIVFLGWEPHPMNLQLKMRYLEGGDAVFGPNFGEARVYTAIPPSLEERCANLAAFLRQLQFTTDMENQVLLPISEKARPAVAARNYLKKHPQVLETWLQNIKTFDGRDGWAQARSSLQN